MKRLKKSVVAYSLVPGVSVLPLLLDDSESKRQAALMEQVTVNLKK